MPTFVVEARNTPAVLSRVVLLLHRRRVPIVSLRAECEKGSDLLRIEVQIEEDEARAEFIERNLYNLVDVMLVERKNSERSVRLLRRKSGLREP